MTSDIDTLRRQLQQLQDLHASGALDASAYEQGRQKLERQIVEQVMAGSAAAATAPASAPQAAPLAAAAAPAPAQAPAARPSRRLVGLSALFTVLVAVAGYAWMGSPGLWNQRAGDPVPGHAAGGEGGGQQGGHEVTMEQISAMAESLAERLKSEPQNAEGWAMLGRSYSVLGRHADAVPAYAKAVALVPEDAGLLADYADALAVSNNRQIAGEPLQLIERALKLDPNQPKALSLAGTEAFLRGDYAGASKRWEQILATQPADSPFAQSVRESIAEARQRGGLPPLAGAPAAAPAAPPMLAAQGAAPKEPAAAAPAAAPADAKVGGTVTLSKALAAQAAPEDTVFVFARAAEGPRMPLAILRKQVKDLPITFTLDDSMAMAPQARLSNFAQVVVGARISKTGNAMAQPGDLQGLSAPVPLGRTDLKIEIGEVVGR